MLSAGSWGTTFAKVLADAGAEVTLFARRPELAAAITADRENADYLPGIRLPDGVTATDDAARALDGAELVVLSIPSQSCAPTSPSGRTWSPTTPPCSR